MQITIDCDDAGQLLNDLVAATTFVEANSPEAELAERLKTFTGNLGAEAAQAREREDFDAAWSAFVIQYQFDDDTERNQQLNGFIEGWVRSRRAAGMPTQYQTAVERRGA